MRSVLSKVIPILPCPDIKVLAAFYEQLGFEVIGMYTSPNPYAVLQLGTIELHFWGSRKNLPADNPSMCFIQVEDVDSIYNDFITRLKTGTGKIPRSGIPKISKVRDLKDDRRFTLTDPGGNTIYVGTPAAPGNNNFFRTLRNDKYAKKFAVLYDIVYSKESPDMAAETLPKYGIDKDLLDDLDKAKFLLLLFEIQRASGQAVNDTELRALLEMYRTRNDDWTKIRERYAAIAGEE